MVGSGQYLHGLLRWLPQCAPHHRYTLLLPWVSAVPQEPPPGVDILTLRTPFDGRSDNLAKLWFEQVSVSAAASLLAQHSRDRVLLHIPYFAPPLHSRVPTVTTIPDMIPLVLPAYRGGMHIQAYMALVSRAARRSCALLTFSHYSRRDIVSHLHIAAHRVHVVMLAAGDQYVQAHHETAAQVVAERYELAAPFIYYVGGLDTRKNVEVLVRALALLRQRGDTSATLAIAGRALSGNPLLFPDLDALIAELQMGNCVRRIDVPHQDGPLLYQTCTIFAYPSRYEGFGLPPLEAMACGAPVVCSNASSVPEVVGSAAVCVAPDDVAGWAGAFARLLSDAELRENMRQQGLARAALFSWWRVAEETVQVYENPGRI